MDLWIYNFRECVNGSTTVCQRDTQGISSFKAENIYPNYVQYLALLWNTTDSDTTLTSVWHT